MSEGAQIIDNLLFYSRIKSPSYQKVGVFEIINECIKETQKRFAKKVAVKKKLDAIKHLVIQADPTQLKEVFNNILNNAYDAVPERQGSIEISAGRDDRTFVAHIKDNGVGIPKEHIPKLFEPFFTTKAKGTGLGLSVCSQIADLHGGKIEVESKVGTGTTMKVILPVRK